MIQRKTHKYTKHKNIALLIGCGVLVLGFFALLNIDAKRSQSHSSSNIQGLQAGDTVTYNLFTSPDEAPQNGQIVITKDHNGALELPNFKRSAKNNMAYALDIERNDERAQIMIRYDEGKQHYSLSGNGFDPLQPIQYGINNKKIDTKTDWAGLFSDSALIPNHRAKQQDTISLAFAPASVIDGLDQNPILIKVASPPLGDTSIHTPSIRANFTRPMLMMSEEITAVMYQHMAMIGALFDANIQMDTQRDLQILQAEAHRDYHPSEQMCVIGTFSRSLHNAQSNADFNKLAYSEIMMDRYTITENSTAAGGPTQDMNARILAYTQRYCNKGDYNGGLDPLCISAPDIRERFNRDIDYEQSILGPLTVKANFTETSLDDDAEDLVELGKNLYWFHPFSASPKDEIARRYKTHLDSRRMMAMHNVAHTSFATLVGQKSEATNSGTGTASGVFMKELVKMLLPEGSTEVDPTDILGENPSYYAMMEMLTKKMYQDPNFYTNLYDKPANIERIKTSLKAIQMMHNRDRYESSLRREMLSSMLLEAALIKEEAATEADLRRLNQ